MSRQGDRKILSKMAAHEMAEAMRKDAELMRASVAARTGSQQANGQSAEAVDHYAQGSLQVAGNATDSTMTQQQPGDATNGMMMQQQPGDATNGIMMQQHSSNGIDATTMQQQPGMASPVGMNPVWTFEDQPYVGQTSYVDQSSYATPGTGFDTPGKLSQSKMSVSA